MKKPYMKKVIESAEEKKGAKIIYLNDKARRRYEIIDLAEKILQSMPPLIIPK